jgi:hypothetical protein
MVGLENKVEVSNLENGQVEKSGCCTGHPKVVAGEAIPSTGLYVTGGK